MTDLTVAGAVRLAVDRLETAASTGVPCSPVRDLLGDQDIAGAYVVQSTLIANRMRGGAARIGRKIGLTSAAVQSQLGVDQPDFGVLLDDMQVPSGGTADMRRLLQPKVEGEIAFRLGTDLAGELTAHSVRAAVVSAHAAIEIVDSRIAGWDITITDTVADNASSGLFVVDDDGADLTQVEPRVLAMTLDVNGAQASAGDGTACLGDPLIALEWLARTAQQYGDPLRAGDLVLSGALGPMVEVLGGDRVHVAIEGLGSVEVLFGERTS